MRTKRAMQETTNYIEENIFCTKGFFKRDDILLNNTSSNVDPSGTI